MNHTFKNKITKQSLFQLYFIKKYFDTINRNISHKKENNIVDYR